MRLQPYGAAVLLCLSLLGCKGGDGGGPPGAQGGPPGQEAPGAPVGPDGHRDQGGAPGAPYKIPATVLLGAVHLDDEQTWTDIQGLFWAACPGRTQCVHPLRVYVDTVSSAPCVFDHIEPKVGTRIRYGATILVVGRTCDGTSPGDSPPPDVSAPASPDSLTS